MTTLNPPIFNRIPGQLLNDPESKAWAESLHWYLRQLYEVLNGGNADLGGESNFNASLGSVVGMIDEESSVGSDAGLEGRIRSIIEDVRQHEPVYRQEESDNFPLPVFYSSEEPAGLVVTSSNYTSSGSELIIATSNITIDFDPDPEDGQFIKIKRVTTAGNVVADGNGNNIDGSSTFTLLFNYDSNTFIFSRDAGEWLIV